MERADSACSFTPEAEESDEHLATQSFATSPIVTIYVGDKQQAYTAHRDILVKSSPFFVKCLSNTIKLPSKTCHSFNCFVNWIYFGEVGESFLRSQADEIGALKAWAMADKFCMPVLQNPIMDCVAHYLEHIWIRPGIVAEALDFLDPHSGMFRLAIDQLVWEIAHCQTDAATREWDEQMQHELNDLLHRSNFQAGKIILNLSRQAYESTNVQPITVLNNYRMVVLKTADTCEGTPESDASSR